MSGSLPFVIPPGVPKTQTQHFFQFKVPIDYLWTSAKPLQYFPSCIENLYDSQPFSEWYANVCIFLLVSYILSTWFYGNFIQGQGSFIFQSESINCCWPLFCCFPCLLQPLKATREKFKMSWKSFSFSLSVSQLRRRRLRVERVLNYFLVNVALHGDKLY